MKRTLLLRITALALLLCAFASLIGCGNSPYAAGDTAKPVLYFTLSENPSTLDPSIAYDSASFFVIGVIYPAYYQYNYLKRDPLVLEPALGAEPAKREKWPVKVLVKGKPKTVAGERWTFRIKKNLRFQDDKCFPNGKGREITARDFLTAFRRMADPRVPCPIYPYFGDKIIGHGTRTTTSCPTRRRSSEGSGKAADTLAGRGLQTDPSDPYTFRIILKQVYPQLRFLMAMPFTVATGDEVWSDMRTSAWARTHRISEAVAPSGRLRPLRTEGVPPELPDRHKANPNYREDYLSGRRREG